MVKISPSVLAADLSNLAYEVADIESSGADMVHLDVMDGAFVTNISFGLPVIASLRKKSNMIFDVHLMIQSPEKYAGRFIEAGADIVTFHLEACNDPLPLLEEIRSLGAMAAISVKPKTPIEDVYPYLEYCDMVLVMTVEPGFGGQSFMGDMMPKIVALREECKKRNIDLDIQVDGGISLSTVETVAEAELETINKW